MYQSSESIIQCEVFLFDCLVYDIEPFNYNNISSEILVMNNHTTFEGLLLTKFDKLSGMLIKHYI